MTLSILAGIETEYGLAIEGRGAHEQIDDAAALLRCCTAAGRPGWDYRFENPRADLRGFHVGRLSIDPVDAKFDAEASRSPQADFHSDRVLTNGARFYSDHGHPEFATAESLSLRHIALADLQGEAVVFSTAKSYEAEIGRRTRVFKNNTDYHGASYGTHESYLVPRELGFDRLYAAVTPILVARTLLTGAGKVGVEAGHHVDYHLS